ncbi:MAG: hypothetical protein ACOYNH_11490 [Bacteroidia bacterium]
MTKQISSNFLFFVGVTFINLLTQFPNHTFTDLPIIKANSKMNAIVTNIVTSSNLVIKAITYFQPVQNGSNIWYPSVVTKITSEIVPIKEMQEKRNFTGSFEILSSNGNFISKTRVKNNLIVDLNTSFVLNSRDKTLGSMGSGKLMLGYAGVSECMSAAVRCWNGVVSNMGLIEYTGYCASFPLSATLILADCIIHEKSCLGISKPADIF